jgi:hypothetical protein
LKLRRLAIIAIIVIIALAALGYSLTVAPRISKVSSTTSTSSFTNTSLAIGTVTQLPKNANYSLGAEYPTAQRMIRMRVVDPQGYSASQMSWTSPNENAQQILSMISQSSPQVLERMTAGVFNWTFQVPVCSGCAPMTYGQFLNASMDACQCYIIPRLDILDTWSKGTFLAEAKYLLSVPVYPRFSILSIDQWDDFCNQQNCNCALAQEIFHTLYQMGWKGVGVLNGVPPYHPTCGWATYVTFDINKTTWQINSAFLSSIKADPTVQRILMYDPDFAGQALALQATCGSASGGEYYSCDQMASAITYAARNQAQYGYTYVYNIEQTFWDSTKMFTSNGTSIYDIELSLMNKYN